MTTPSVLHPVSLLAAGRFLTRLPLPGPPTRLEHLQPSVAWFPLVGAAVGAAIAGLWTVAAPWFGPGPAAVLAVAAGLLLTGGFHEDGAADAADGLGGGQSRERVLEIMKDSRIGAYGAMALWVVLAFRAAALPALGVAAVPAFVVAMAWGRWSSALIIRLLPPTGSGLAKEIAARPSTPVLLLASLLAIAATALAAWLGLPAAWWAPAVALPAAALWILYLRRRLGGHTGDLLGAGNQSVEGVVLVLLLALTRA